MLSLQELCQYSLISEMQHLYSHGGRVDVTRRQLDDSLTPGDAARTEAVVFSRKEVSGGPCILQLPLPR